MSTVEWILFAVSLLSFFGVGYLITYFWGQTLSRKKQQTEQAKARAKKEKQDEIREVLQEEISPIIDSINNINKSLTNSTAGVVTLLRDRMKSSLNSCKKQGWASASDKANWNELYKTYKDLGGNHFIEYVDTWKNEMNNLPTEAEHKVTKSTKTKK